MRRVNDHASRVSSPRHGPGITHFSHHGPLPPRAVRCFSLGGGGNTRCTRAFPAVLGLPALFVPDILGTLHSHHQVRRSPCSSARHRCLAPCAWGHAFAFFLRTHTRCLLCRRRSFATLPNFCLSLPKTQTLPSSFFSLVLFFPPHRLTLS